MERVRVGLIGCGVIGKTHINRLSPEAGIEVVAVADRIAERAAAYASDYQVPQTFSEGADLIDQAPVDVVILAFPTAGRHDLGLRALRAGKHLLTEKPVAMSVPQLRELIAAQGSLKAGTCSCRFRFTPSAQAATALLARQPLGHLRAVRCRNLIAAGQAPAGPPPEWRLKRHLNGGGILVNWGCYDLDYVLGLTGWTLRPQTVFAQTWPVTPPFRTYAAPDSEAETHLVALIRCQDGIVIEYERGEFMSSPTETAWSVIGCSGALHLQMLPGNGKKLLLHRGVTGEGVVAEEVWSGDDPPEVTSTGPLLDLVAAIREDREPSSSLTRALALQQITDAVYESAASGRSVDIA
ncbi:MAG: Gfo/Idh/MocA family oxidoreductase [Fimbriimonadaceae bacterium]|nr:Gfo/Idh/MocA family oxidoreductase [Fimbriimonadaceae bacterium]